MRRPLMTVGALLLLGEVAGANVLIRNDIFIFAAVAALIMIYISNRYDAPQKKCSYLLLFFVFIAGGMIGISSNHAVFERKMNASGCSIVCEIMSTEEKEYYTYLIVRDSRGEKHLIKMTEMKDAELLPGYYIEVEGSYEGFSPASNPGGYSEKDYYEGIGLSDIISVVRISDTGRRDYLRLFLYKVKKQMKEGLYLTMEEREAGVVAAMILGERNGLDKELKTLYQESGIAHILAISSLHVMLIGSFLIKIFRMLGVKRDKASYLTILILMLYGMMTGFAASTLRAAVMISLSLLAARLRRKEDMATSLCIAMIIIGITNPHILSGAGNILSLTAVIGVMAGRYIYDSIFGKDRFLRIKKKYRKYVKGMIKGVIMSVSINAVMLPVIIYNYYEVPVFGMILNLVVIPLLTVVVGAGFVAGILGMVSGAFGGNYMGDIFLWCGRVAGYVSEMILRMYEFLCKISIKIPFSRVVSGHTDLLHVSIYYLLLGIFIYIFSAYARRKRRENREAGGMNKEKSVFSGLKYVFSVLVMAALLISSVWIRNMCNAGVVFLDVGQGSCCIVHGGFSGNYIYDAGSSDRQDVGTYVLVPALKYYGIGRVDMIFISHSDKDHISGIEELVRDKELLGIKVSEIAVARGVLMDEALEGIIGYMNGKQQYSSVFLSGGDKKGFVYLGEGDEVSKGRITFSFIYPNGGEAEHSGNEYSLVGLMKFGDLEVVFPGDIGEEAERRIITSELAEQMLFRNGNYEGTGGKGRISATRILACPHHGSKYSSTDDFIYLVSPDIVVISCGAHNMYGHPAPETLARYRAHGCTIYRTDISGAVLIE